MELSFPGVPPADLVDLHQKGALSDSEYGVAVEWATRPPARERWANYLRDWFLLFGVLLLVSGVVMFGAYNWQALHRFHKLGILQLLIVGTWTVSRLRAHDSKVSTALLWGACLLVGALLAVFGQIYQTGADAYTLFLGWSLLIAPWCLAGRSNLIWFSEALLLNVTFTLYYYQMISSDFAHYAAANTVFNVLLAALWEVVRRTRSWMSVGVTDALLACALAPVTVAACLAPWEGRYWLAFLVALVLLALLVARFSTEIRKMAMVATSAVLLVGAVAIRVLSELEELGFLLIALVIIAEITVAAGWLRKLNVAAPSDPVDSPESQPGLPTRRLSVLEMLAQQELLEETPALSERHFERAVPRYVSCLTALGAWIAAWFFLFFLGLAIFDSETGAFIIGLFLFAGSLVVRRRADSSEFISYLCLAVNIAGQLLTVLGLAGSARWQTESMLACALALHLIGLFWYKDSLGRSLFAFASVLSGGFLSAETAGATGLSLWLLLVALLVSSLLVSQRAWLLSRWRYWHGAVAFGLCCGLLCMVGLWGFQVPWLWEPDQSRPWLTTGCLTLVAAVTAVRLQAPMVAVVVLLLLLGIMTFTMPGLMAAILVFVLAYHTRSASTSMLAILGLLLFGVLYYYNLELDFLSKSISLIASGALLLCARSVLRPREVSNAF